MSSFEAWEIEGVGGAVCQSWNPAKPTILLHCDLCRTESCSKTALGQELTVCGVQEGVPVEGAVTAAWSKISYLGIDYSLYTAYLNWAILVNSLFSTLFVCQSINVNFFQLLTLLVTVELGLCGAECSRSADLLTGSSGICNINIKSCTVFRINDIPLWYCSEYNGRTILILLGGRGLLSGRQKLWWQCSHWWPRWRRCPSWHPVSGAPTCWSHRAGLRSQWWLCVPWHDRHQLSWWAWAGEAAAGGRQIYKYSMETHYIIMAKEYTIHIVG